MTVRVVTSALPYVNNLPHLGNVVGCVLSSDVFARYSKKLGIKTIHICGTDEYGTATEISAIQRNLHPKELCDMNSREHKKVYDWFNIHFDYFGRTSHEEHIKMVHEVFFKLYNNGYFIPMKRDQFFCLKCNIFLADRFVNGTCKKCKSLKARGDQCDDCGVLIKIGELIDPQCSLCSQPPILKQTEHLFLKLDCLHSSIKDFCGSKMNSWSLNAQKITKQWLDIHLTERCMTRDLKYRWGVPVPIPGFEEKVFYVWFDAPIGYFTFLKQFLGTDFDSVIRDESTTLYQFMGKDNVAFHSIIFPAMLLGTKDKYKLVDVINSTEYLQFEGEKFSKSRNVGIFGSDLIENEYGPSCFWRYYLIKIRPENKDANFSFLDFKTSINSDLINNFGNFVNRSLKFVEKKMNREINAQPKAHDHDFVKCINDLFVKYKKFMDSCELKNGLNIFIKMCNEGNSYLQEAFSTKDADKKTVFSVSTSLVHFLAHVCEPFVPVASQKIFSMIQKHDEIFPKSFHLLPNGHKISNNIEAIFQPFTEKQLERLKK